MASVNPKSPIAGSPRPRPAAPKSRAGLVSGIVVLVFIVGAFFQPGIWSGSAPTKPAPTAAHVPASAQPPAALTPPTPPPAPPEPAVAPATDNTPAPAERLATAVKLLTSPALSEADAQQAREMIATTYAPLYQQLNLSPADAEAFGNLLAQRVDADREALAAAASQGLTLADNPTEVAQLVRAAATPVERQIRALLGSDGYPQYQAYAAPIRAAVANALRQNPR